MNEISAAALFAPPGGWRVRILDLSGGAEDGVTEEIGGFSSLMHANAFAERYVRDSIELCRAPGLGEQEVLEAWMAFGEDAEVLDAGEGAWRSTAAVARFAAAPANAEARNWRALDPRADVPENDDDAATDLPPQDIH
jgi:hypothetical protein